MREIEAIPESPAVIQDEAHLRLRSAAKPVMTAAFRGLVILMVGYYARIEDWIPGGRILPLATIGGVIADLAMLGRILSVGKIEKPKESRYFILLMIWLVLTVPVSTWPGGSYEVVRDAAKALMLGVVVIHAVNSIGRLKVLLAIQCVGLTLIAFFSRGHVDKYDRMIGAIGGVFENSNDLGLLIAVTVPLVLMFMLQTNKMWVKALCGLSLAVLINGLMLTFSRTGFIALAVGLMVWLWHFGVKAKRKTLVNVVMACVILAAIAIAPTPYGTRVASIFDSSLDENGTSEQSSGSREARQELLIKSIEVSFRHPLFGVGPGQFAEFSGSWHVSHDIYLQFSSESGFPSLILYLILLRLTFKNLKRVVQEVEPRSMEWNFAAALRASLIGFAVGTFFANFGYQFFTYIFFGYCTAIRYIALPQESESSNNAPRLAGGALIEHSV